MKKNIALNIIRWIVGLLFIFSGLIKANDPLGLSYKMQEFFESWGWSWLNNYTLIFALIMNVFEVLAGVAVIIGWRMRLFSWLLLLLIIFFCFLTGYALLSGKIKTCGCFGDCLPLTPLQSFSKDFFLLLLIILIFIKSEKIKPLWQKNFLSSSVLFIVIIGISILQFYVLKHLPLLDCLPYKVGNNINKEMSIPSNVVTDSFALTFRYKKNDKIIEFDAEHIPANLDSTYQFVERYDKLIRKGTDAPAIADFALQNINGTDTTSAILNQQNYYVLVFVQDFANWSNQQKQFQQIATACKAKNIALFVVTAASDDAEKILNNKLTILRCDATIIKTAARVNATYFLMQQATILAKNSYADADEFINKLNRLKKN
ncbi:MAG: BT_3928 family protein [Chitinophagaceae bacterium]